jgi:thiol reductant ABC exporter CydD subunit
MQSSRSGRRVAAVTDPRLLRYARAARPFLVSSILLGLAATVLLIAQAWLLAYSVAAATSGDGLGRLGTPVVLLLAVVLLRGLCAWAAELNANRTSIRVKQELRGRLIAHLAALGPASARPARTAELAALATRGLDALDPYFSLYLPQLVLALIAPLVVLAAVAAADWVSAAIIAVTLPLIPLFMALIGAMTRERTEAQLRALGRLSAHFLDALSGLTTLKVFGRAKAQHAVIAQVSGREREATMATLKVTFLSSLVLELLATLSVALVATAVGLRLLGGDLSLRTALFVLVLAPEAYLPLRQLGTHFHASAEGLGAARQVFAVLEQPVPRGGARTRVPPLATTSIEVEDVSVRYPGYASPALAEATLTVEPGETLAISGPSGCGKSTLLHVLLGFVTPTTGSVRVGGQSLADFSTEAWRQQIAWVPQRPQLIAGSIADNVRLARPDATDGEVLAAVNAAGLAPLLAGRRERLDVMIGEHGAGISAGERQRVALARAFVRATPLLLLDEPTASLDGATEEEVLDALARLVAARTALVVAHRPSLLALADRVVDVSRAAVVA